VHTPSIVILSARRVTAFSDGLSDGLTGRDDAEPRERTPGSATLRSA
jgi:hypothetical protein